MRSFILFLSLLTTATQVDGFRIKNSDRSYHATSLSLYMASRLSPLVENMAVSKTIEIHSLTMEMKKNGRTVYSLCVGEPDYQPPPEVLKATVCFNKEFTYKVTPDIFHFP